MIIALVAFVFAVAALLSFLFGLVILGMRQEPAHAELSSQAPNRLARMVRCLLGVYVGKAGGDTRGPPPLPHWPRSGS